jgi:hypothetical protein
MSLTTKPTTFSNGTTADGTQVNANFDALYNDYNGNITDDNIASSGITTYGKVNGSAISALANLHASAGIIPAANLPPGTSLATVYPIGSIYINAATNTNPATLFGFGTWTAFGSGKVLVGVAAGDSDFGSLGATGGEKTHTLTVPEMPAHTHDLNRGPGASGYGVVGGNAIASVVSGNTGGDGAHNNLQPFITVYMWVRQA